MKLTVLGGGGTRMPAFVRAVLDSQSPQFDRISLFEPDPQRRWAMCRLATAVAEANGHSGVVGATADVEEACTGADFVFSAIRVGGDRGRAIDEQVALRRGLVGQETTGAGGCAMALRTIPVVLSYCEVLKKCAPQAVLINFTNPAGTISQAISAHSTVNVVGVCDTPSSAMQRLSAYLRASLGRRDPSAHPAVTFAYAGLNHLGWVTSAVVDGEERMGELLSRYEQLQLFDHTLAPFDPGMVRWVGALPTEYLFYYYDPQRYISNVAAAGVTRGQFIERLNEHLFAEVGRLLDDGDVAGAWARYAAGLGLRRRTYMADDTGAARPGEYSDPFPGAEEAPLPLGGYEALALAVVRGLTGDGPASLGTLGTLVVNARNGTSLDIVGPDDIVEAPALVRRGSVATLPSGQLPLSARGLVAQVKEYERAIIEAAVTGDAALAAIGLSLHPLVPGLSVARELIDDYRQAHGPDLAYLR